jgi:hypothetical protein
MLRSPKHALPMTAARPRNQERRAEIAKFQARFCWTAFLPKHAEPPAVLPVGTVRQWLVKCACAPKPLWPSPSMPLVSTARVAFVETPSSYELPQPFKASPTYSRDEVVATPTAAVDGSSVFDNAGGGEAHP